LLYPNTKENLFSRNIF